jgi:hypothetical protein
MFDAPWMITRISFALVAAILLLKPLFGNCAEPGAVRLNTEAFQFAANLITQGRFVADKKGAWTHDHPPRSRQNAFIRDHGFADYTRWHLGVDDRHGTSSKARYKFPFGDFQNVHRCGLLAVKARAREFGDQEIEDAATKLLEMIESAGPCAQKRVD